MILRFPRVLSLLASAGLLVLPLGLSVVSCAKAPTQELYEAELAIDAARKSGAPLYHAEEFAELEQLFLEAKQEIDRQYRRSEFAQDFGRAKALLVSVKGKSKALIEATKERKQAAKARAVRMQEQAHQAVQHLLDLVAQASNRSDVKEEVEKLNDRLAEVDLAIRLGDHPIAEAKASAIVERSKTLKARIRQVPQDS